MPGWGSDRETGRAAGISWQAAEGGVLVTGAAAAGVSAGRPRVSAASVQLVHAAIRRRKPVLVVDLCGPGGLPGELAGICADAGAPLHVFGPDGQGCYEPLRGGDPARKAALVMGMIDWAPVADHARRTCGAYLNDLFAVAAAAPADPRVPVLDDVAALLGPAALRARMRQVPPYHPRRGPLGERVRVSASLLEADPATASFLAGELTGLRASTLGRWLRPGAAQAGAAQAGAAGAPMCRPGLLAQISLSAVVRERAVAFFPLDQARYGRSARMIANLVALDLTAVFAESRRLGVDGDGLAWFGDGDARAVPALAQLMSTGAGAGLATVVSTGSAAAAGQIAAPGQRPGDPGPRGSRAGRRAAGGPPATVTSSPSWSRARSGRWCRGPGSCRAGSHDGAAGGPGVPRLGVRAGAPGSRPSAAAAHPARPGTAEPGLGCGPAPGGTPAQPAAEGHRGGWRRAGRPDRGAGRGRSV